MLTAWLDRVLICYCRTVPTNDQILVPETLLKKRKSQEKARAERSAALEKKKAVSSIPRLSFSDVMDIMPSTRHSLSLLLIL